MAFAARAQPGLRIHDLSGGREGQSLEVSARGFTFTWERKPGGLIAIGNDTAAGTDPGQALVESPDYTSLLAKADVPDGARWPHTSASPTSSSSSPPRSTQPAPAWRRARVVVAQRQRPLESGCSSRSRSAAPAGRYSPNAARRAAADLAQRGARLDRGDDRGHQIAAAGRHVSSAAPERPPTPRRRARREAAASRSSWSGPARRYVEPLG